MRVAVAPRLPPSPGKSAPADGQASPPTASALLFTTQNLFAKRQKRPPIHPGFSLQALCRSFLKLWEAPAGSVARWELRALARCSLRREEIDTIFGSWAIVEDISVQEVGEETVTTIRARARPVYLHFVRLVRGREDLRRLDRSLKEMGSDAPWLAVGIGPEIVPDYLDEDPIGRHVWPLVRGIHLCAAEAEPARFAELASLGFELKKRRKRILFTSVEPPLDDALLRQVAALFQAPFDLSFRVDLARRRRDGGPGEAREPYRPWGHYRPQPFDLCSPAPLGGPGSPAICVANPLPEALDGSNPFPIFGPQGDGGFLGGASRWIARCLRPRRSRAAARLAAVLHHLIASPVDRWSRLLDYLRREKYLNEDIREKRNHRYYTAYCFYNECPHAFRVDAALLLDEGIDFTDWSRALADVEARFQNVRATSLFDPQEGPSAGDRAQPGRQDLVDEQLEAHDYLLENPAKLNEVTQHLISLLPPRLGRCLDLGSGRGDLTAALAGRADRVVSFDLNLKFLARSAASDGRTLCAAGDMHALPFRAGTFQTVILDNVAEHSFLPLLLLSELRRILAPGGKCYLVVPLDGRIDAHAIPTHLWKPTLRGLRAALELNGFERADVREVSGYDLGMSGCFPTCNGTYGLAILEG